MKVQEFNDILYEKDEATGIVTVTLNAPKRKNAMSFITNLELFYAVQAMEEDDGAKAMIITGAKDPDSNDPTKEAISSGGYFTPKLFTDIPEEIQKEIDLTDLAQKKLCLKIAGEEGKHCVILENLIEFLQQPDTWMEDAEWRNMSDY